MNKKINAIYLTLFSIFSFAVITYGSYTDLASLGTIPTWIDYISLAITYLAGLSGVLCVILVAK